MPAVPTDELIEAYAFVPPLSLAPFGQGRIHRSFRLVTGEGDSWLGQRLNTHVFPDPQAVAHNIRAVTAHLAGQPPRYLADGRRRPQLELRPTVAGDPLHRCADGSYWRVYRFIEGSTTAPAPCPLAQVEQAAQCFGEFLRAFAAYPADRLAVTIPHFHDTPRRYRALQEALASDPLGRAGACASTIAFAEEHRALASVLQSAQAQGGVPTRVVHNDCKLDNVLFDTGTGEALCVVDLDTVMAGLAWHDVGDLIRSLAATGSEEQGAVEVDPRRFEAVVRGYLRGTGDLLTGAEVEHLAQAGQVITYELALRFLTDHLNGDHYFLVEAPGDNLRRAQRQFALVASMAAQADTLAHIVCAASKS